MQVLRAIAAQEGATALRDAVPCAAGVLRQYTQTENVARARRVSGAEKIENATEIPW